ncbi:hypothetical protein EVAR_97087_1 [Eumeta japonica]|uniref:Uncharacterized protein n=1 Tax=Eumeta variegata TaxID=151549 RepID=A0A4C1X8L8_EUMVA|nr:hypothetical protein EVAR_97087_1 [Eumeta japonica]
MSGKLMGSEFTNAIFAFNRIKSDLQKSKRNRYFNLTASVLGAFVSPLYHQATPQPHLRPRDLKRQPAVRSLLTAFATNAAILSGSDDLAPA